MAKNFSEGFLSTFIPFYRETQRKQAELLNRWLTLPEALAEKKRQGIIEALNLLQHAKAQEWMKQQAWANLVYKLSEAQRKALAEQRRLMTAGGRPKQADPYRLLGEIDMIKTISTELSPLLNEIHAIYVKTNDIPRIIDRLNQLKITSEPIYRIDWGFPPRKVITGYNWHIEDPVTGRKYTVNDMVYSKLLDLISTLQLMQQSQTPYGGRVYQYETVPTGIQPAPTQVPQGQLQPTQMKFKINLNDLDKMLQR